MAKHEIVTNRLTSNDLSSIKIAVKESYEDVYHYSDFADDEQINKRALDEVVGGLAPTPYVGYVTNADSVPKQVGIPGRFANTEIAVTFELTLPQDGSFYPTTTDGATMTYVKQYSDEDRTDVSRIDIYGAPDGNGKFLDSFKFTIFAL